MYNNMLRSIRHCEMKKIKLQNSVYNVKSFKKTLRRIQQRNY